MAQSGGNETIKLDPRSDRLLTAHGQVPRDMSLGNNMNNHVTLKVSPIGDGDHRFGGAIIQERIRKRNEQKATTSNLSPVVEKPKETPKQAAAREAKLLAELAEIDAKKPKTNGKGGKGK